MKWTARWTRDRILFITGLLGVAYETLIGEGERPALLVLFAGMLGLPVFLKKDDKAAEAVTEEPRTDDSDELPRGG